jgi:methylated-DNA-[protein]-cysteine S-methyltransferase
VPTALFETPLGPCGIAWAERGITRIMLPEATADDTRRRLAEHAADGTDAAPPRWVAAAMAAIARHLGGAAQDFTDVRLDVAGLPPFHARIYEELRRIPSGRTVGYGELAALAGSPKAFRAVGQAMAKNPFPIVVPCHRVLAAGGKTGGFSAYGGTDTKARILALEGVRIGPRSAQVSLFPGEGFPAEGLASATGGLGFDPAEAARALAASDRGLAPIIEKVGPLRLDVRGLQTPFEALAESIVYQQLTGKAAATILSRVHALYGTPRVFTPDAVLATDVAALRTAGLSGSKVLALKDLAAKTIEGIVPSLEVLCSLQESEIVERLTQIRGIGRWSVEMLLIFRLGRPDVLPTTDYGVRKGFARAFRRKELPTPAEVAKRGERWRPYRTAASWYLWRACELPPNSRAKARATTLER